MDDTIARRLLRAAKLARPSSAAKATASLQTTLREALPKLSGLPGKGLAGLLPTLDRHPVRPGTAPRPPPVPDGASFLAGVFAGPAGSRPYRLYIPSHRAGAAPLVVMLHGCTQTAEDFATGTRMNERAEAAGALVLYPVQTSGANAQRCWNWFQPADQQAGHGEPAIIAGMVGRIVEEHGVDPGRVFAAGLSAGGAEAAILGAAYPSLFSAIGVHSGLACGAASDLMSALTAMRKGHAGHGRITVPAIVFHGDRDGTVNVANAGEVAAQAAGGGAQRTERGQVPGGLAWTRTVQPDDGRARLEQWIVHGGGHAWSGGSPDGSYTEPRGPDASREMLRFFLDSARPV